MKKKAIFLFPLFCLALLGFGLYGLMKKDPLGNLEKPIVLTTIAPYAGFLEELGEGHFEVVTLIPPNFDPHVFEPTPKDLLKAGNSALWVRCGEHVEEKFDRVLPEIAKRVDLPSSKNRSLSHDGHCCSHHHAHDSNNTLHTDPHYWTSPKMLREDVAEIADALAERFPERRGAILSKSNEIQHRLASLDAAIRSALAGKERAAILVSHSSFGPFCDDYGIEQISLEDEGKELSGRGILEKKENISSHKDLLVVSQPQHPFPDLSHFELDKRNKFEVDPYSPHIETALLQLANQLSNGTSKE